jgi:uncharacterized repeat protein (TIGR03803 family)
MKRFIFEMCTGLLGVGFAGALNTAPPAQAQETVLHNFGYATGKSPISGPVYDTSSGAFYGATSRGGAHQKGVVYQLTPPKASGGRWRYSVLYDNSYARTWVAAAGGVVYVAASGNRFREDCPTKPGADCGAIFSLTPPVSGVGLWTQTTLYSFTLGPDGNEPWGRLAIGGRGALYGTASQGGAGCSYFHGCGTVFKLAPPATQGQPWSYSVLFHFPGRADGQNPDTGVILDKSGNLYGTAEFNVSAYSGTISKFLAFKLAPPAAAGEWTETVLYRFSGPPGGSSISFETPLTIDASGALYGSVSPCASDSYGCIDNNNEEEVFQLVPSQADPGVWNFAIVRKFPYDRGSPAAPYELTAPLTVDAQGTVYGATLAGGPEQGGTVFALRPRPGAPGEWDYKSLINFKGSSLDLVAPNGGLAEGPNGLLYGATQRGGSGNEGSFFSVRR